MQAHPAPSSRALAWVWPMATGMRSSRNHKHQMFGHSRVGQARGECCAQAPAAHKAQARRLGRGDVTPVLSHYISAVGISPHSRRPVLETLPGIGLHFPAERICAARGAFHSVRALGSTPSRAQSLAHQQTVNVSADVPHIQPRLSSSAVSVGIDPNENGLTHAKRSFAPGAKAND